VLASLVWTSASLVFSRAVSQLMQFGVTYGSFSAAIIVLVYLYFAAAGLLFGAELNAVVAREGTAGTKAWDENSTSVTVSKLHDCCAGNGR
jgi:uncharacterized BrkB/YihY/UPF0761 family membrane protein